MSESSQTEPHEFYAEMISTEIMQDLQGDLDDLFGDFDEEKSQRAIYTIENTLANWFYGDFINDIRDIDEVRSSIELAIKRLQADLKALERSE